MDTNVIIGFFGTTLPLAGKRFVAGLVPAISVITQIELFASPKSSADELLRLNEFVKTAFIYHVLDEAVVRQIIAFRRQRKMEVPDAIIAATALVHGLTLLTRNTKDFARLTGLAVLNPFDL